MGRPPARGQDILPVVTREVDLGEHLLEIGPGPGAATEWLRQRVTRLTAVEIDPEAASALAVRFPDVEVVTADATDLPYPDESFDSVATSTLTRRDAGRFRQPAKRPAAPFPRGRHL